MAADRLSNDDAAEYFDDRLILRDRSDWVMLLRIACRLLVAAQVAGLVWLGATVIAGQGSTALVESGWLDFVVRGGFIAAAPFSIVGFILVSGLDWAGVYDWGTVPYGLVLGAVTVANWCVFVALVRFAVRRVS